MIFFWCKVFTKLIVTRFLSGIFLKFDAFLKNYKVPYSFCSKKAVQGKIVVLLWTFWKGNWNSAECLARNVIGKIFRFPIDFPAWSFSCVFVDQCSILTYTLWESNGIHSVFGNLHFFLGQKVARNAREISFSPNFNFLYRGFQHEKRLYMMCLFSSVSQTEVNLCLCLG